MMASTCISLMTSTNYLYPVDDNYLYPVFGAAYTWKKYLTSLVFHENYEASLKNITNEQNCCHTQ